MPWRVAALAGITGLAIACDSSIEIDVECPAERVEELAAVEMAVEALEAMEHRHRDAMAVACANVLRDLTGQAPSAEGLSHDAAHELCTDAHAEIEARIDAGTVITMTMDDEGGCAADPSAEEACLAATCSGPICTSACAATGIFEGRCEVPSLTTSCPDSALEATLDANFPTVLALDVTVLDHAGSGWHPLLNGRLDGLANELRTTLGCKDEVSEQQHLNERLVVARNEMTDLVSWVRISMISDGG